MRQPSFTSPNSIASGARALVLAALALSTVIVSWAGCGAGGSNTSASLSSTGGGSHPTSTGTKSSTSGPGGSGGGGAGGASNGGGDGGPMCGANQKACNGQCVAVDDPMFGCTPDTCVACAPPGMNAMATCVAGPGGGMMCSISCASGFKNCDGDPTNGCETDTSNDPQNCGGCGAPCSVPHATAACNNGMCAVGTCDQGWTDCDGMVSNGCEANLNSDDKNCGMCGVMCANNLTCSLGSAQVDGGTLTGDAGVELNDAGMPIATCNLFCPKGKTNCDGNPADGCNVSLGTNQNCNFCGDTCNLANSMSNCGPSGMPPPAPAYVCTLEQCSPGFANCDMIAANGCEVDTQTDANNCGTCGNICPSGPHSTAVCVNGGCALNCDPGYSDCDNNPFDGCEIHSDVDVGNCGTCMHQCITPNATPVCNGGMCEIQSCFTGFADCDMNPANGCEINTNTNPNDCGTCGFVCSVPNAQAACVNGMCAVGICNNGYSDCDHQVSNGCEDQTGTDVNNCGTCGHACMLPNATPTCSGGVCQISACNQGFQDCNHQPNDGCEANLQNDPLNCGACNHQCFVNNGVAGCVNGQCTVMSCNPGFADCNNNPGDGCETVLGTTANCASCGNNCSTACTGNVTATQCIAGAGGNHCEVLACGPGYYDIDAQCNDGCECQTKGTSASCNAPTSLGTLAVGQMITYTGNLVPAGQEAYLSVTMTGNTNFSYHPSVTLTTGAAEFAFDIEVNCTPSLESCGVEGGNSSNDTVWETQYTAGDPNNAPQYQPIPLVGTNGTIVIHVKRRPGKPVSCNGYTLTIGN